MNRHHSGFRNSHQDREAAAQIPHTPQTDAASYRLAFADNDFLCRPELRPVRLQLELLKPEMVLDEQEIESTVVLLGGARVPAPGQTGGNPDMAKYYDVARTFAKKITERSIAAGGKEQVITTGGGPGVMEAGNLGARDQCLMALCALARAPEPHLGPRRSVHQAAGRIGINRSIGQICCHQIFRSAEIASSG